MALIKDVYSTEFYQQFASDADSAVPGFNAELFLREVQPPDFGAMEFKQRMLHTAHVFHQALPAGFSESAESFAGLISYLKDREAADKLAYVFLPEYIALYGIDHFSRSAELLELVTQFVSAEFAVRPFLLRYFDEMIAVMHRWSQHADHRVRRLASEGSRPRLPWALAIPALKRDPTPVLQLLENLMPDPSPWVRKSVANHLNDISKDHPDVLLRVVCRWKLHSPETDAIIKHACRTLFKQGYPAVLSLYGLDTAGITLSDFRLSAPEASPSLPLSFSFCLKNELTRPKLVRIEYAVYHLRAKGQLIPKVFKISERTIQPGEELTMTRKHPFKPITTRVYYPGTHQVALIINGSPLSTLPFELSGVQTNLPGSF
ncbi:DNA alkylation repair protein [Pedobacter sp. SYP-B3415]|uniref:DNA alkylation repair protein n=1 Tax=Pedobacter sp. SYP-B3415 TaxID=2496641 RepID=UPI00101E006C|nr:DNA alkylation repair protein [Pedobacter sp. SYP-B3415]